MRRPYFVISILAVACLPTRSFGDVPGGGSPAPVSGFVIDSTSRKANLLAFHRYYMPSENSDGIMNFTGNVAQCIPGTISSAYQDAVLRRINYHRAQAGLPGDIYFAADKNAKCQESAILSANKNALTHNPNEVWLGDPCVTPGAVAAAGASNLALGSYGPTSIDRLMLDGTQGNERVGHRRWFLYSMAQEMGHGSVPDKAATLTTAFQNPASTVWVVGNFKSAQPAKAIPWPNAGYCPYMLAPNAGQEFARWSFTYPGADFTNTAITMALTKGTETTADDEVVNLIKEPLATGSGDNTVVWKVSAGSMSKIPADPPAPGTDREVLVNLTGIAGAPFSSYSYKVVLYNPFDLQEPIAVTGSDTPSTSGGTTYGFNQLADAESYCLRLGESKTEAWAEGAEDSPSPNVMPDITYPVEYLRTTQLKSSGVKSFNLLFYQTKDDQSFEINRDFLPIAGCRLQFKNRFRWFQTGSYFLAEISTDGTAWSTLYSRRGVSNDNSTGAWESSWTAVDMEIPAAYIGKQCRIRFRVTNRGTSYFYYNPSASGSQPYHYGVFIDDVNCTSTSVLTYQNITALPSNASSFVFDATTLGKTPVGGNAYFVQIAPILAGRRFDFSLPKYVTPVLSQAEQWRQNFFGSSALSGDAADLADPDGDEVSNLMERALGTNPKSSAPSEATRYLPTAQVAANLPQLHFTLPEIPPSDITYEVQASDHSNSWTTLAQKNGASAWSNIATGANITQGATTAGHVDWVFTDVAVSSSQSRRFLRLRTVIGGSS